MAMGRQETGPAVASLNVLSTLAPPEMLLDAT